VGGIVGHQLGHRLSFERTSSRPGFAFCPGAAYILFSLAPSIRGAIVLIAISRMAMVMMNV